MKVTSLECLFQIDGPWILTGHGESERKNWSTSAFYAKEGLSVCARHLRGKKMTTVVDMMAEMSAALQFFPEFGENWSALEECLCYLDEWLPADAYVIVVENSELVLSNEEGHVLGTFLSVLHDVGRFWSNPIHDGDRFDRPAIPFHILFLSDHQWTLSESSELIGQIA